MNLYKSINDLQKKKGEKRKVKKMKRKILDLVPDWVEADNFELLKILLRTVSEDWLVVLSSFELPAD